MVLQMAAENVIECLCEWMVEQGTRGMVKGQTFLRAIKDRKL